MNLLSYANDALSASGKLSGLGLSRECLIVSEGQLLQLQL